MLKEVVVFNDISGFGRASLTVAIPILSALCVTPHPIPTAVYTNQSGYPYFYSKDMTSMFDNFIKAWKDNDARFDAVYSGFLTNDRQADYVLKFIEQFKSKDMFILIDPVMGDNGEVYHIYSENLLEKMKKLTRIAHLITPNLTEACLLAGIDYTELINERDKLSEEDYIEKIANIAKNIRKKAETKQDVIITGVKFCIEEELFIYNIANIGGETKVNKSHMFDKSFSGTGDIFASAMCGLMLNGYDTKTSMDKVSSFLYHSIADTMNNSVSGKHGIDFEPHLIELIKERR